MTFATPDVVAAVMRHMNGDHAEDCLLICRTLGGQPHATAAVMSDMDQDTIEFRATVDGREVPVRIPFRTTLTERADVRVEVTRMYHEARAQWGLPARPDEH